MLAILGLCLVLFHLASIALGMIFGEGTSDTQMMYTLWSLTYMGPLVMSAAGSLMSELQDTVMMNYFTTATVTKGDGYFYVQLGCFLQVHQMTAFLHHFRLNQYGGVELWKSPWYTTITPRAGSTPSDPQWAGATIRSGPAATEFFKRGAVVQIQFQPYDETHSKWPNKYDEEQNEYPRFTLTCKSKAGLFSFIRFVKAADRSPVMRVTAPSADLVDDGTQPRATSVSWQEDQEEAQAEQEAPGHYRSVSEPDMHETERLLGETYNRFASTIG